MGLFFAGARLLWLEEMVELEMAEAESGASGMAAGGVAADSDAAESREGDGVASAGAVTSVTSVTSGTAAVTSDTAVARTAPWPLTDLVGFQQLACCASDGSVLLLSGFNAHRKAPSWPAFLAHVLRNTV